MVGDTRVEIGENYNRHSLIVTTFGGYGLHVRSLNMAVADSLATFPSRIILNYDDYGDFVGAISAVTFNNGALSSWIIETYIEEQRFNS